MTQYKIHIRDSLFTLVHDQITFDSPNYFSNFVLGDWKESADGVREMTLSREPLFFKLIEAHLSGYKVLPIPDRCIPECMTGETAMENFLEDARFYGLTALEENIQSYMKSPSAPGEQWTYWYKADRLSNKASKEITKSSADLLASLPKPENGTMNLKDMCSRVHNYPRATIMAAWWDVEGVVSYCNLVFKLPK